MNYYEASDVLQKRIAQLSNLLELVGLVIVVYKFGWLEALAVFCLFTANNGHVVKQVMNIPKAVHYLLEDHRSATFAEKQISERTFKSIFGFDL